MVATVHPEDNEKGLWFCNGHRYHRGRYEQQFRVEDERKGLSTDLHVSVAYFGELHVAYTCPECHTPNMVELDTVHDQVGLNCKTCQYFYTAQVRVVLK